MADDNQWKVVSESPSPTASAPAQGPALAPALTPTQAPTALTPQAPTTPPQQANPAPTNPAAPASSKWQVTSEVPTEKSVEGDSIDQALGNHPTLQKVNKGLQSGMASGLGITTTDPDDPTKPNTWGGITQEVWGNLKKAAIENYEKGLGPAGDNADARAKVGSAVLAPFHMAASGIEGMASTLEDGYKDIKEGMKGTPTLKNQMVSAAGSEPEIDHEKVAQGFGKMLASAAQIAMGMERNAVNSTVSKLGAGVEKGAAIPGNSILRATNPKSYLYGKVPGRVFIDEPIKMTTSLDSLAKQFDTAEDSIHQQLRDKLSDPAVAANKIDVVPEIDKIINKAKSELANEKGLANRQGVIKAIDTVRDDILNKYDSGGNVVGSWTKTRLSPLEVNEIKRSVGKNTKWDTIPGSVDPEIQQYVNDVRKAVYGRLNDIVDESVSKTPGQAGVGVKALNARYANAIEASRLLSKRIAQEGSNELGMRRLLARGEWAASIGALLSGEPLTMAAGGLGVADRVMRSTPGRIARAKVGAAAGQAMQAAGKSGLASRAAQAGSAAASTGVERQDWVRVQTSDGKSYEVHPEDLDKLKERDPKLKVLEEPPQD